MGKQSGRPYYTYCMRETSATSSIRTRHYECSVLEDGHPEREEDNSVRQGEEQRDGEGDLYRSDWDVECFIQHAASHHVVEVEQLDSDGNRCEDDRRHPASQNLPAEKHAFVGGSA